MEGLKYSYSAAIPNRVATGTTTLSKTPPYILLTVIFTKVILFRVVKEGGGEAVI